MHPAVKGYSIGEKEIYMGGIIGMDGAIVIIVSISLYTLAVLIIVKGLLKALRSLIKTL